MSVNQDEKYFLCDIFQEVSTTFNNNCPSIEQFRFVVETLELNIQNLEKRVQKIQQEVDRLIASR